GRRGRASNPMEGYMSEQPAVAPDNSLSRRDFVRGAAAALFVPRRLGFWTLGQVPVRPAPSPAPPVWQPEAPAPVTHFRANTLTDREWGDGHEDPAIFDPARLDPVQWARTAHAAGFRAMILTAKHHDGFCLWPTRTTEHSVAKSPWRGGQGDVVRAFADAC